MNKTHNDRERKRKTASRRKKELALALAVSLWIATGGVASADNSKLYIDIDANDKVTATGGDPAATGGTVAPAVNTTAAGKTLTVTGGDWSGWNIYGGYSATGNAEGNTVTIFHDSLPDTSNVYAVYGGYGSNIVTGNIVNLTNSNVGTNVYGGYSQSGNTRGNTVNLTNSYVNVNGNVYGGYSPTGSAGGTGEGEGNTVNLTNSHVVGFVYGGYGNGENATGNTVNLTNSSNGSGVYGGRSQSGTATGNTVTIVNDSLPAASNVYEVYGGFAKNDATGNTVNLTNANTGSVSGGVSNGSSDHVTGNTLHLSGANKVSYIKSFETIYIEKAIWDTPVLEVKGSIDNSDSIDASKLTFANPETIPNGAAMNLIECTENNGTITAQLAKPTTTQAYELTPVTGVTVNAALTGNLAFGNFVDTVHGNKPTTLTYTASNKATKLTFEGVEWKDSGALIDHATTLTGVSFDGADVDTSNISFKNLQALKNNEKMTLVSNFGDTVGTITGTKYKVGTTLEGEGKASLSGKDLIFTTGKTGGNGGNNDDDNRGVIAREQTHNTVMGAEVSMAAISAGSDFVGAATEGLALSSNAGADGVSSFAQMGGGSMRQETGSHVDSHTWNAILAIGHQNKKERGTFEYGAFFEYGTGNYTTYAEGGLRGDGSATYTGGGVLAKWTASGGNYIEGSLRAGSVKDDARNVLRDGLGTPYSYETNTPYLGGHIGAGKEITLANGNVVDVYGKYFYNRRNSTDFTLGNGDRYDLDAVTSQVLRIGARYTLKRDKWNFYGGVAYEHEFDGKATGTADGVAIRGADTSGGSFRGELGATVKPSENSPWNIDFNVTGFAGKKQGVTGGVSVSFMF